jgi:hypothetical protein
MSVRSKQQKFRRRLSLHREGIHVGIIGGFRNDGRLVRNFAADKQSKLEQY